MLLATDSILLIVDLLEYPISFAKSSYVNPLAILINLICFPIVSIGVSPSP